MAMARNDISKIAKCTAGIIIIGGAAWGIVGALVVGKRVSDFNDGLYAAQVRYIEVVSNLRTVDFNESIARREGISATRLSGMIEESMQEGEACKHSAKGELLFANRNKPVPLSYASYFSRYNSSMVSLEEMWYNLANATRLVSCAKNIYAGVRVNVRLYREWAVGINKLTQNTEISVEKRENIASLLELGISCLIKMDFKDGKRYISEASNELTEAEEMIFLLDEGRSIREVVAEQDGSLKILFNIDQHLSELEFAVKKGDEHSVLENMSSIKKIAVTLIPDLAHSYGTYSITVNQRDGPTPAG